MTPGHPGTSAIGRAKRRSPRATESLPPYARIPPRQRPNFAIPARSEGSQELEVVRGPRQVGKTTLRNILRWYVDNVRKRPLDNGRTSCILLDEIHKLKRWDEEVKHIGDTFPVRMLLTSPISFQ